jgi:hypothetical protein
MDKDSRMIRTKTISDVEFERQIREAKLRPINEPAAAAVYYKRGEVHIELESGWNVSFPPGRFSEFQNASERDLRKVALLGRYTLTCEPLDVDMSIGGILLELIGDRFINAEAARRRGEVTSERKKVASRTNGKLGGRPKKSGK